MGKKANTKLPKTIAGVKIPKRVRKTGGSAVKALRHPLLADIVAAALLAAAAAIRDNKKVRRAARTAKDKAGDAAKGVGAGAATLGTVIAAKAKGSADWLGESYAGATSSNGSGSGKSGKSTKSSSSKSSSGKSAKSSGKKSKKKS